VFALELASCGIYLVHANRLVRVGAEPAGWDTACLDRLPSRHRNFRITGVRSNFMQLARVIGNVVSIWSRTDPRRAKDLIVQTLHADLTPKGKPMVALDAVGARSANSFSVPRKEASFRLNATIRRPIATSSSGSENM
jgi:microcompartment protein CcmK/EutM